MSKPLRKSPTIREIIEDYLVQRSESASVSEIYNHVRTRASLASKNPRATVFSVLTRMGNVTKTGPGNYTLRSSNSLK